ncbi:MAG: lamin tail domain-containing protein, partial [Bacteroidota bacterium]
FIFDQLPPKLSSWKIINPYQLRLYFSEAIRTPAASDFEVVAIGIPDSILVSQIQPNEVRLFFAKPLSFSESVLNMNNITDLRGNRQQTPSQVAIDNAAVTLGLITALSSTELRLDFTHSLDEATMLDPARYRIDQTDSPINVTAELSYVLHLTLGQAFQPDATYELSIDQIVNVEGQTFDGILDSFTYQTQIEYIQAEQRALVLHFQIPLDSTDAVKAEHYHLDDFPPVAVLRVDERKVRLVFDQSLEPLTRYELAVEGLRTIDGDIIPVSVHSVGLGRSPNFNELLITEIMAAPSPTVGLPNAEYLEFYNASDDLLDISGIRLSDATSSTLLPSTLLLPGEYLIVCAHQDQPKLSAYGRSLGVSSFPSLNSSGDQISLTNFYGGEIFSVSYSDDWYNDAEKKQGGWSLEMVDYTRPCGEQENWTASVASAGGTPGQGNSVNQPNPDNQSPYLQVAFAKSPTEVTLLFSEKLDPSSFESGRVSISNDVAVDTVMWQTGGKSATVHLIDSLQVRITYTVQVSQLSDCSGNMVDNQAISLVLSEEAAPGDVLLSEILFYPRSGGVRFVEIYNNSDKPINLKGWQLANLEGDSLTNQSLITDENYQLAPQQYVALTEDIITLMGDYPVATEGNLLQVEDLPSLPSDAGNVTLLSPSGEPMQYLAYDEDWHHPILDDVRGVSLERISWETEVNDPNNWQSAAQTVGFATPGYANSQTVKASLTQAALSVEPRVFTPDQDGFQDYTQILYRWPNAGNVANVIIFDSQGRKVKHLARNTILSEEGFLRWDGTDDAGQQLSMGYYIIYFEVFHTNGQVSGLKERVVLGRPF